MERVAGLPAFWSTSVAKIMVGDQPCLLSAWLPGHFKIEKRPRTDDYSLAKWKVAHTEQLSAYADRLKREAWVVRKEQFFRVKGTSAVLSGKADIVAQADGRRPLIVDIKSGVPRESDVLQVLLEMVMIPISWGAPYMEFEGRVVYPTHTVTLVPAQAQEFKPKLMAMMKRLGSAERPQAFPSRDACRFCDVSVAHCPQRFDQEEPPAETTEF